MPQERDARTGIVERVGEFARKKFTLALPAAKRAASHASRRSSRSSPKSTPKSGRR